MIGVILVRKEPNAHALGNLCLTRSNGILHTQSETKQGGVRDLVGKEEGPENVAGMRIATSNPRLCLVERTRNSIH